MARQHQPRWDDEGLGGGAAGARQHSTRPRRRRRAARAPPAGSSSEMSSEFWILVRFRSGQDPAAVGRTRAPRDRDRRLLPPGPAARAAAVCTPARSSAQMGQAYFCGPPAPPIQRRSLRSRRLRFPSSRSGGFRSHCSSSQGALGAGWNRKRANR